MVAGVGYWMSGGRVVGWSGAGYGTGPGTVLGTVLAPFPHCHWPLPALAWPNGYPRICTRLTWCGARLPGTPWHHRYPGYTTRHHLPHMAEYVTSCHRFSGVDGSLGSLLAAPVVRLSGHVTWPVSRAPCTPLIGTT